MQPDKKPASFLLATVPPTSSPPTPDQINIHLKKQGYGISGWTMRGQQE